MVRNIVALLAIILLVAPAASAQYEDTEYNGDYDVSFAFGPQGGLFNTDDADDDVNWMVGLQARSRIGEYVGAELSANYRQANYFGDELTVRSFPVMLSAMVFPIEQVYGLIGGGWYNTTFDFDQGGDFDDFGEETENEFGWHVGGGAQTALSENTSLTLDARYIFLEYDEFNNLEGVPDVDGDSFLFTVGFLFGDFGL